MSGTDVVMPIRPEELHRPADVLPEVQPESAEVRVMTGLRIGSLCTGYGGLDMAVEAVFAAELAWLADNDPGAMAITACRFPDVPNLGDITAVDWTAVEPIQVLTAGFPCQDVSCAGARKGLRAGTRTGVWSHVAEAIRVLRPPLIFLENVRGLLSAGADSAMESCPWCLGDSGEQSALRALGAVLGDLATLGFDAEWSVVSAADAGAPHRRERVFILAWPAADTGRDEPDGHGAITGLRAPDEGNRPRPCDRGTAEDTDRAARGERRLAASGQAESGRPRADTGRPGGAPADTERRGCTRRSPDEGEGSLSGTPPRRHSEADRGSAVAADPGSTRLREHTAGAPAEEAGSLPGDEPSGDRRSRPLADWGPYGAAITRWERVTGRRAPGPTEPGRTGERLSPRFVEWMQGLPDGWVTDVPGLSRNARLHALGNGVVPQQAAMALRMLLARTGTSPEREPGPADVSGLTRVMREAGMGLATSSPDGIARAVLRSGYVKGARS